MVKLTLVYNDLNEKLITVSNTLDGSMLGDNLIKNHNLDYQSPALIPAKAVENDHEHLAATRYRLKRSVIPS